MHWRRCRIHRSTGTTRHSLLCANARQLTQIFASDHILQNPGTTLVYLTGPFEPDGVLQCLSATVLGFLGVQAGRIALYYEGRTRALLQRWIVWGVAVGVLGLTLCQGSLTGGWIPLNASLTSLSLVFCVAGMAFVLLAGLYVVIDMSEVWNGAPFIYPGVFCDWPPRHSRFLQAETLLQSR